VLPVTGSTPLAFELISRPHNQCAIVGSCSKILKDVVRLAESGYAEVMEKKIQYDRHDHWRLAALMVAVQLLDIAVVQKFCSSGQLNSAGIAVVRIFHYGSGYLLLFLLGLIFVATMRSRLFLPGLAVYLGFSLLHLAVNVGALLFSATAKANGLASLWDVGAIGGMSILTFAACYLVLDRATPDGAFLIAGREGRLKNPQVGDYLYLSFEACTAFGPTIETPVSRPAKYLLMLQVGLSVIILTVLLSRAVTV